MKYPSYTDRAKNAKNPMAEKLFGIMKKKETNLCVSADLTKANDIIKLAKAVGDEICVLKTHIDIIEDFSFNGAPETKTPAEAIKNFTSKLREIADEKEFLIFEDRKFADIGNTVKMQFDGGIYKIAEWADIVNVHALTSYVDLPIMNEVCRKRSRPVGILVLAQMTPKQLSAKFFDKDYAQKAFAYASAIHDVEMESGKDSFILGFIGSSEQPEILNILRDSIMKEIPEMLIMTPGIKIASGKDDAGQTYNTPEKSISNGGDVIIVGRGIYQADDPAAAAEEYRKAGWDAYQDRCA